MNWYLKEKEKRMKKQRGSIRTAFLVFIGLIAFAALTTIITKSWNAPDTSKDAKVAERMEKLKKLREEDQKKVTSYEILDKEKGKVAIPIERAKYLALAELRNKKIQPVGDLLPEFAGKAGETPANATALEDKKEGQEGQAEEKKAETDEATPAP